MPDARDGLKPVHRRILYSMHEAGYTHNKPYRKSARVVGDVIGKYHPHGDQSVYDALVRMAQEFSMRVPLVDGQGNFGSVDGDPPAAMRYTEVRMTKAAEALLEDLDLDTVDFQPNYDNQDQEPIVLPARFPNLLVNGSAGIAVGMATNIPPHNLGEVVDACLAYIADPEIGIEQLIDIVPGPDFPTAAQIMGRNAARLALVRGRGGVVVRARTTIEEIRKDREAIIVTELPFQVNKAQLIERIAELVTEKRIEGISDVRDESDRHGMRMVIELKRDAMADVVLNQLYRYTALQIVVRRQHAGARSRAAGVDVAQGHDPRLRQLPRGSGHAADEVPAQPGARQGACLGGPGDRGRQYRRVHPHHPHQPRRADRARAVDRAQLAGGATWRRWWRWSTIRATRCMPDGTIKLSEEQAKAILELRLQRLTALGRDEIGDELQGPRQVDRGISRHPALARAADGHRARRARRRSRTRSRRRARPRSSTSTSRSKTKT